MVTYLRMQELFSECEQIKNVISSVYMHCASEWTTQIQQRNSTAEILVSIAQLFLIDCFPKAMLHSNPGY